MPPNIWKLSFRLYDFISQDTVDFMAKEVSKLNFTTEGTSDGVCDILYVSLSLPFLSHNRYNLTFVLKVVSQLLDTDF
jgi:hypothetical protein